MNSISAKAILFDLDGVLVDSTACVTRVWTAWAEEHGYEPEKVVHIAHGRRAIETVKLVAPHLDAEAELRDLEQRELNDVEGLVVVEGAAALLASIPGDKWAVVTSGTRALSKKRLQIAGLPVPEKLVSADDVKLGKPNPAPYLAGAKLLGVSPSECLVIEDAPSGIRAAKAAGMRALAVPTTYHADELREADVLLERLSQVRVLASNENGDARLLVEW